MSNPLSPGDRAEYQQRAVACAQLMRSDGWKMFATLLEQNAQAAEQAMFNAKDAFEQARHVGALRVLRDLKAWPERELTAITRALQETVVR